MESLYGIKISTEGPDSIFKKVKFYLKNKNKKSYPYHIVNLNMNIFALAYRDNNFKKILNNANSRLVDGIGIKLLGLKSGLKMGERMTGTDFCTLLIKLAAMDNQKIMFLGGKYNTAFDTASFFKKKYKNLIFLSLSGAKDIKKENIKERQWIIDEINRFKPALLFIAYGSPYQEYWIDNNKQYLKGIVCIGVGGAFNFYSGKVVRAPKIVSRIGLEWVWRLFFEPRRILRVIPEIKLLIHLIFNRFAGNMILIFKKTRYLCKNLFIQIYLNAGIKKPPFFNNFKNKLILFFPEKPTIDYAISKICIILGIRVKKSPNDSPNFFFKWEDTTVIKEHKILNSRHIINGALKSIDKTYIDKKFKKIFGYSASIKPKKHNGYCVKKSRKNAAHDGTIIRTPVLKIDLNSCYQKLIDNQINIDTVLDIRAPIFLDNIPFVYLKYKNINKRFGNENKQVTIESASRIFSADEYRKIILFSKILNLDYGELDILRDNLDGKIYVIDVNNTPYGPPNNIGTKDKKDALLKSAEAFIYLLTKVENNEID